MLPLISKLPAVLQTTIETIKQLFEERPAWTRRALRPFLETDEQRYMLRHAIPYVGYIFRSGPWRDAIIKLGHDPRSSPEFRHYQTFMFRFMPSESENNASRDGGSGRRFQAPRVDINTGEGIEASSSYVFTGKLPLHRDGRIWMVCDIEDPLLKSILYPADEHTRSLDQHPHLREVCEDSADGWYWNGTISKVKVIMRNKIQALLEGHEPADSEFEQIVALPDYAETEEEITRLFQVNLETASPKVIAMATDVRAGAKSAPGWRRVHLAGKTSEEKKRRPNRALGKKVEDVGREEGEQEVEESEGEEEEIERAEMLEDQVAAAVAARDEAEAEAGPQEAGDDEDSESEEEDE